VFVDLRHRNATTSSMAEASLICDLIAELLACGVKPDEIGVVTPYRAQARTIRNLLHSMPPDSEQRRKIIVDTVERMQGQERDVILLSLTTSNPAFAAGIADFFLQPERLNVAITRARVKLIIVGSSHLLSPGLRGSGYPGVGGTVERMYRLMRVSYLPVCAVISL
jgi:DNA replication ATP-dependent helicase Dna2